MKKDKGTIILIVLALTLIIVFIVGTIKDKQLSAKNKAEATISNEAYMKERQRISNLNVYQKLKENRDIKILVIGDSIGAQAGRDSDNGGWMDKLGAHLKSTYKCNVIVKNIAVGSTVSYEGYNDFMQRDLTNYDLVFLCFGQNDKGVLNINDFNIIYEDLIRQIRIKNTNCDIIPIVESSLRQYNDYSNSIINLSTHYCFNYADTIDGFNKSGIDYSQLSKDGVHPNDNGYDIYFNIIKNIIDKNVTDGKSISKDITPYNEDCTVLDKYKFIYKKDMDFKNNTYTVNTTGTFVGLSYKGNPDGGKINVYVNGKFVKQIDTSIPLKDVNKARIISDILTGTNTIKLEIVQEAGKNTQILGLITNES